MEPTDRTALDRALRDLIIEAPEEELRAALSGCKEGLESLAADGKAVIRKALDSVTQSGSVRDLHRGLGALIQMLRRIRRLSIEEVARDARVDANELRSIEVNPDVDPNPRTIFQLEQYFQLPAKTLVALSGAVRVDNAVREEAVRFAANSQSISALNRAERKLLNQFVRFLREHSDG